MVIESFGPEIIHIPGPAGIVVDAISCLDTTNNPNNTQTNCDSSMENHLIELANLFAGDPLKFSTYSERAGM